MRGKGVGIERGAREHPLYAAVVVAGRFSPGRLGRQATTRGQRRRGRVSRGQGNCHAARKNSVPYYYPAADDPSPFTATELQGASAVVDMVYADHPTRLATLAGESVSFADGREFLANQGFAQFAAFTQKLPPKTAMRAALA